MKTLLAIVVAVVVSATPGQAVGPDPTPVGQVPRASLAAPPYPMEARRKNLTGKGLCYVVFDASGHLSLAVMTKSTGSKILDDNTLDFARKHWSGQPNLKVSVPITYEIIDGVPPDMAGSVARGTCQVAFNASGHVASAVIIKSTGSKPADKNILDYAQTNWEGPPNTTSIVPIFAKLR